MDIFGSNTSLKICKRNIYRHGERIKLRVQMQNCRQRKFKETKNLFVMVSKNSSAKHL